MHSTCNLPMCILETTCIRYSLIRNCTSCDNVIAVTVVCLCVGVGY